jgi:hypothetical protein
MDLIHTSSPRRRCRVTLVTSVAFAPIRCLRHNPEAGLRLSGSLPPKESLFEDRPAPVDPPDRIPDGWRSGSRRCRTLG